MGESQHDCLYGTIGCSKLVVWHCFEASASLAEKEAGGLAADLQNRLPEGFRLKQTNAAEVRCESKNPATSGCLYKCIHF